MSFPDILWNRDLWGLLVLIIFIAFGIASIALVYHWKRYGQDLPIIRFGSVVFMIGSVLLIILIMATYQALPR